MNFIHPSLKATFTLPSLKWFSFSFIVLNSQFYHYILIYISIFRIICADIFVSGITCGCGFSPYARSHSSTTSYSSFFLTTHPQYTKLLCLLVFSPLTSFCSQTISPPSYQCFCAHFYSFQTYPALLCWMVLYFLFSSHFHHEHPW